MSVWFLDVGDAQFGHVPYSGRRTMVTDDVISEKNIGRIVQEAMQLHEENRREIAYLMQYERGVQPIRKREKTVRSDINHKVCVNHASSIVAFKTGYEFGTPLTIVQRADKDISGNPPDVEDKRVAALNEMLHEQGKQSKDESLAHDFYTTGVGYRMVLPKRKRMPGTVSPFDLIELSPLTTFVIRSADVYHEPVLAVSYTVINNGMKTICGCYTDDMYYTVQDGAVIDRKKNGIGMIPIVEYHCDHENMGAFERCLTMLDCLNDMTSDRMNSIDQLVQSLLVFLNCDIDKDDVNSFGKGGTTAIAVGDGNAQSKADVKLLESMLDQAGTQTFCDFVLEQIQTIAGVPGTTADAKNTTGEAVLLSSGWQLAETAARSEEHMFKASDYQTLALCLRVIDLDADVASEFKGLKVSDIDIKFSRNRTDALLTKVQSLQLLFDCGMRNKHALEAVGIWSDVQTVWDDSKDGIEEAYADVARNGTAEPVGAAGKTE